MLATLELGRRLGRRRYEQDPETARAGLGAVEGSLFGLFGLLVAFTFSGAAARFDARRALVTEEANAVGTAFARLDVLPEGPRSELRALARRYLDERLAAYAALPDLDAAYEHADRATELQKELWSRAVIACAAEQGKPAAMLLLPALNSMFDVAATRLASTRQHPPVVVFMLLFALGLGCSLLAGYDVASAGARNWLHVVGFAAIVAGSVYVILDMEYPRLGAIRVDAADQSLIELRQSMGD